MSLAVLRSLRGLLLALLLLLPGLRAAALDDDRDGVPNNPDNCLGIANPRQRETDRGRLWERLRLRPRRRRCVRQRRFRRAARRALSAAGDPRYDPALDADGDGAINARELGSFKSSYQNPVARSRLACAGTAPCACDPPVIDRVEEVLAQDVEVAWTASGGFALEIERSSAGGAA